ncbi:epidermal retinol dehydrogenase 2-like [Patiria miniata]|uniref:Short-chain dehydrogenase/reductase 3 n=1 Tax=Patiria miniata TaxID=46514 RepID=A0A913ZJT2_PATMI|nr:epidermal retinol dehydrogenase 2-like [Patiria miniata]
MHIFLDVLWMTVQVLGLLLWSWIKFLLPSRPKSLDGETVLVTGGGSGIGRLMAVRFAQRGCTVILWDVNEKGNEETAVMIREAGGKVHAYTVDVSKMSTVTQAAAKVKQDVGEVSILVNNAGIIIGRTLLELTEAEFTRTMAINAMAHVWTFKAFLPDMIKRNHGHIVTIASVMGYLGLPKMADYCASKAAAQAIHETVEREALVAGADKINFTVVNPYLIHTGMFSGVAIDHDVLVQGLEPEYVADRILQAVQTNQRVLCMPRTMYALVSLKGLFPVNAYFVIEKFFNVWAAMDKFVGRNKTK